MKECKYIELFENIREKIIDGTYAEKQKLPSENELVKATGYSRQTVRQAISLLEHSELVSRVQGSGTYVNKIAPKREATMNIAVVTTYIGEYIFPAILSGIDSVLTENGYTSMISATKNRVDNERKILSDLLGKPIDGLIVEGTKTALPNPNIDLYEKFAEQGIPVVFINGYYPDLKKPVFVVADDRKGGEIACKTLIEKGHTKIAGIFKSDDIQGHRRYAGYAQTLRSNNVEVNDDRVIWYTTENRDSLLERYAEEALAESTAVVCYNDEVALKISRMFEGIEIVSFDNSTYAQLSANPFLSLSNPKEKIGEYAAQKVINILRRKDETSTVLQWEMTSEFTD